MSRALPLLIAIAACGGDDTPPRDAGGVADSATGDGGSADGGTPIDAGACVDPPPPLDRSAPSVCSACRPDTPEPTGGAGECTLHMDCTAGDNGRCIRGMMGARCSYDECFDDSGCAADEVCSCDGALDGANVCRPANCRTNADCTSGRCSASYGCLFGAPPEGWYCHTASDACDGDGDCTEGGMDGRCEYDTGTSAWACEYTRCKP